MKIEIVQLSGRDADTPYNLQRTLDAIEQCAADTDILLLPEAQLTGFLDADTVATLSEAIDGAAVQAVQAAARARNVAVVLGLYENDHGTFYNTTLFIAPEGILLKYRKTHLWVPEHGIVTPGDRYATVQWRGVHLGLLICYDSEFPETARALAAMGAELFLVTDGLAEPDGHVHRISMMARALENQAFAVSANRVGAGSDDCTYAGGSRAIDPHGNILFEAGNGESRHSVSLWISQKYRVRAATMTTTRTSALPWRPNKFAMLTAGVKWSLPRPEPLDIRRGY